MDDSWGDNQQELKSFPSLSLRNVSQFSRSFPSIREPEEIGSFSITGPHIDNYRRQYHDDRRGLRRLYRRKPQKVVKELSLNLNQGLHSFVERVKPEDPKEHEHLELLLQWIVHHKKEFLAVKDRIDIVCWRGKIYELMCTPYERSNGWIMCCMLIDGVIYMTGWETSDAASRRLTMSDKERAFTYWGYKFEQIMLSHPEDKAALNEPVNNFDGFQIVIRSRIGNVGLLFGAEVDCVDPKHEHEPSPRCYVELKTSRKMDNERQHRNFFNFKVMKWWAQSFMAGIPMILVGYRDDHGKVIMTEEIETKAIPNLVKQNGAGWEPAVCANFVGDFFTYLKETVTLDHERAIYKFEWQPGWDSVRGTVHSPDSQYRFVPDWYLSQRPR